MRDIDLDPVGTCCLFKKRCDGWTKGVDTVGRGCERNDHVRFQCDGGGDAKIIFLRLVPSDETRVYHITPLYQENDDYDAYENNGPCDSRSHTFLSNYITFIQQ